MPRLRNIERALSDPGDVLPLPATQYKVMQAWAEGNFINDFGQALPDDELLPDALDRLALESLCGRGSRSRRRGDQGRPV